MAPSVVFISNFFNHHQQALADNLYQLLGENFCFVETTPVSQDRISLVLYIFYLSTNSNQG